MSKKYYSEYADHCWRFYVKTPVLRHDKTSGGDKLNWSVCNEIYCTLNTLEKDVLLGVYRSNARLKEAVSYAAACLKIPESTAWRIIEKAQNHFAERRGL